MTENNILAMHEALLSSQRGWEEYAGAYRTNLVWVGTDSYSPRGAAHVGPQSELIADAKTDLLEFIKHDDLPVVALPSESVSFWSKMGAGIQLDLYLD